MSVFYFVYWFRLLSISEMQQTIDKLKGHLLVRRAAKNAVRIMVLGGIFFGFYSSFLNENLPSSLSYFVQPDKVNVRKKSPVEVLDFGRKAVERLCSLDSLLSPCAINLNADIAQIVIDKNSGGLMASQVDIVLSSTNFYQVVLQLKKRQKPQDAYRRESTYTIQANNIAASIKGVSTPLLHCDLNMCGLTINYLDDNSIARFEERFFVSKAFTGNFFIAYTGRTETKNAQLRALFFPDNFGPVVR